MTFEDADKIVDIWIIYIEHMSEKITLIFSPNIPESFLPFPKEILEEAINIHFDLGNHKLVRMLQDTIGALIEYKDDKDSLLKAAKSWNNENWSKAMLPIFKEAQNEWMKRHQKN